MTRSWLNEQLRRNVWPGVKTGQAQNKNKNKKGLVVVRFMS